MESKDERQRLLEEWMVMGTIVDENPCGMKNGLFAALREVVHSFIGKACIEGASREQVARYLQHDVRTITRWKEQYPDFPKAERS